MPINYRVSRYALSSSGNSGSSKPASHITIALDILFHLPHFATNLIESDTDTDNNNTSNLIEELKTTFIQLRTEGYESDIDI